MRSRIYKRLTVENRIALGVDVLEYLELNVKDEEQLQMIVAEYKRRNGPRVGNLMIFKEILEAFEKEKREGTRCKIRTFEVKRANLLERYKFLKNKTKMSYTPIYLIDGPGCIFGCYYRDENGRYVVEDDGGTTEVDFESCKGNVFLCEQMFVAMSGTAVEDKFFVDSVHLPVAVTEVRKKEEEKRILFISDFRLDQENCDKLRSVVEKMSVNVVVLMGRLRSSDTSSIEYSFLEKLGGIGPLDVILCPDITDYFPPYLPKNITIPEELRKTVRSISNPCMLEISGCTIGVIRDDIFQMKEKGVFLGEDYVESFVRSLLSQYNLNPFSPFDLGVSSLPNVLVVGQNFCPFVVRTEDILFISCPSFTEEGMFLLYNTYTDGVEILHRQEML